MRRLIEFSSSSTLWKMAFQCDARVLERVSTILCTHA